MDGERHDLGHTSNDSSQDHFVSTK
jgi:hypothetical protein